LVEVLDKAVSIVIVVPLPLPLPLPLPVVAASLIAATRVPLLTVVKLSKSPIISGKIDDSSHRTFYAHTPIGTA
jgi:hypothetical protein